MGVSHRAPPRAGVLQQNPQKSHPAPFTGPTDIFLRTYKGLKNKGILILQAGGLPNGEKMILRKCYSCICIHLHAKGKLTWLGKYPVSPLLRGRDPELIHHGPPRRSRNQRPHMASCCPHLFCTCISFENLPSSVVRSLSPFF